jgi:hypothetical protein
MADTDSNQNRRPVTLSFAEIHSLADRLAARAISILLRDEPEQARDIGMAAAVIRALSKHFNYADTVTIENGA